MEKFVHIWQIKCRDCGNVFDHIFRARDILRPHIFTLLSFKCPKCGASAFDPVKSLGKLTLEDWKAQHPDLDLESLPDYSYEEEE